MNLLVFAKQMKPEIYRKGRLNLQDHPQTSLRVPPCIPLITKSIITTCLDFCFRKVTKSIGNFQAISGSLVEIRQSLLPQARGRCFLTVIY